MDAPSEAVSLCCWLHVVPLRTKTYAAPCNGFGSIVFKYAPTTTVFPSMDTEEPNMSVAAPSEAVNSACRLQVDPLRTNA